MRIDRIWARQPGDYFFVSTKSVQGDWEDHPFRKGETSEAIAYINDNQDKNVYVCPHGFSKPKRKREFAVAPNLLWADLDEVDPRKLSIRPTMAWETSPGRYAAIWLTDRPVSDELNQRWSYHIGADRGGWDYSQVLRLVPGTTNFKYPKRPKVKLLWADGPSTTISDIERAAPKLKSVSDRGDWEEVYKSYESKLPLWMRRELMRKVVPVGKRSEMLWKLEHGLIEAGLSREEAFIIIRASAWNKFAQRRDGDEQLRRELDKIVKEHGDEKPVAPDEELDLRPASGINMEKKDWIWPNWLIHGSYHLLAGPKGTAKSTITFKMAATISTGGKWPDGSRAKQGIAVIWNGEDDPGQTIVPRLAVAGADLSRVFIVSGVNSEGKARSFDPSVDFDMLLDRIERLNKIATDETRKVRLLTLDPVVMVLAARTDSHKAAEVRRDTQQLVVAAKALHIAVVGVTHFSKNSSGSSSPTDRVMGSQAMTALPRVVMLAVKAPTEVDKERRLLVLSDINIGKPGGAFEYWPDLKPVPGRLDIDDNTAVRWGDYIEGSAAELIALSEGKNTNEGDDENDAMEFLKRTLGKDPMLAMEVIELGAKEGFSEKLLRRLVKLVPNVSVRGVRRSEEWSSKSST